MQIKFRKISALIILFLATSILFSQVDNKKIDSLKGALKKHNNSQNNYIDKLNNLAKEYWFINLDSARYYANKAYSNSQKENYTSGKALALKNIGVSYYYSLEFKEAINYFNRAITAYTKLNDLEGIVSCKINLANIERANGNTHLAYKHYKEALEITNTNFNKRLKSLINHNLGMVLVDLGNYEEAILYTQNAATIAEEIKDPALLASCYNNMSTIYLNLKLSNDGAEYLKKAIEIYTKENNVLLLLNAKIDLARLYVNTNKFVEADKIINKTIFKAQKIERPDIESYAYRVLGELKIELKEFKLAEKHLLLAYDLNKKSNDVLNLVPLLIDLGKVYKLLNNFKTSLYYLDKANKEALLQKNQIDLSNCHLEYHAVFKKNRKFEKALYHFLLHKKYQDSIFNNNKEKTISGLKIKFDTEVKERENKILKKDNLIKGLKVKTQKNSIYFLVITNILGIVVLVIVYRRFIAKRKMAIALKKKNNLISAQKLALQEANKTKQKFFSIIAHDLVNPFNAILGYTNLLENDFNSFNNSEKKEFVSIINKYALQNYKLVKDLLDWARTQQNRIVLDKNIINLRATVLHVLGHHEALAIKKDITTEILIESKETIFADENCLKTILNNLYSNAIKFSYKGGKIVISVASNSKETVIQIKDFGVGFTSKQLQNLFKIDETKTTKGTNNEKGTGFGLLIAKEFAVLHGGSILVTSSKQTGTVINVTFLKE